MHMHTYPRGDQGHGARHFGPWPWAKRRRARRFEYPGKKFRALIKRNSDICTNLPTLLNQPGGPMGKTKGRNERGEYIRPCSYCTGKASNNHDLLQLLFTSPYLYSTALHVRSKHKRPGAFQGVLASPFDRFMQDVGYGFPRISLLGSWVNRG